MGLLDKIKAIKDEVVRRAKSSQLAGKSYSCATHLKDRGFNIDASMAAMYSLQLYTRSCTLEEYKKRFQEDYVSEGGSIYVADGKAYINVIEGQTAVDDFNHEFGHFILYAENGYLDDELNDKFRADPYCKILSEAFAYLTAKICNPGWDSGRKFDDVLIELDDELVSENVIGWAEERYSDFNRDVVGLAPKLTKLREEWAQSDSPELLEALKFYENLITKMRVKFGHDICVIINGYNRLQMLKGDLSDLVDLYAFRDQVDSTVFHRVTNAVSNNIGDYLATNIYHALESGQLSAQEIQKDFLEQGSDFNGLETYAKYIKMFAKPKH